MLIQINTDIAKMAKAWILIKNFQLQMKAWEFIIFRADVSSSVHINNKNKDVLSICEGPTQRLDDTTLIAEAKYPFNFKQSRKGFALSLHYNGSNSFFFINAKKLYQSKTRYSNIKDYTLC